MIALLGNLTRDFLPGEEPRVGGAPFHAAHALGRLETPVAIHGRCALADREELLAPFDPLEVAVSWVPGVATAEFEISYDGDRRSMRMRALGDRWTVADLPDLAPEIGWVHVAPLARTDFPVETLAALAERRRVLLDGQGLTRPGRTGEVVLDGRFDPEVLRHVSILKLNDEEAEVLGGPESLPVSEILLTHGSKGASIYVDGKVEHVPAEPLAVDPTGAGDLFCVSYLSWRSEGAAPLDAARRATAVVAAVLAGRR